MNKKLVKHGNSWALILDKPILELLKIDEKTSLGIRIEGNELIIRPIATKQEEVMHEQDLRRLARSIMQEYEDAFRRLSKS